MSRRFLFPGHNYLGPGNPLNNGPPLSKADSIAQQHDQSYNTAKSKEDIFSADRSAIKKFALNIPNEPLPSLTGAVGLGAKYLFEKGTNRIFYPNLPGKQQ